MVNFLKEYWFAIAYVLLCVSAIVFLQIYDGPTSLCGWPECAG